MHQCRGGTGILAIVVILFSLWPEWIGVEAAKWVLFAIGVVLLLHAVSPCHCWPCSCGDCKMCEMRGGKQRDYSKKKRR